ncbi:MAG: hypothetical protein Q9225_007765 [Loekoesia sp. 1 TL-2023]
MNSTSTVSGRRPCLTSMPPEIILMIYGSLPNFDDAASLSATCQLFQASYQDGKIEISKRIIAHSEVYKYDRILNKYDAAITDLRLRYRQSQGELSDKQSKATRLAFNRLGDPIPDFIDDEEVHMIRRRWQSFKILRCSYRKLLPAFEEAHAHQDEGVKPLPKGSFRTLFQPNDSQNQDSPAPQLDKAFKPRFHRALCLHTMAMSLRQLGLAGRFKQTSSLNNARTAHTIATTAWMKGSQRCSSYGILTTKEDKYDGLEVFDFIYSFLLPELFPRDTFITWIAPMYTTSEKRDCDQELTQVLCRAYLYPSDVADLLRNNIWEKGSEFPKDKTAYLMDLGFLEERMSPNGFDWWTSFTRRSMVMAVCTPRNLMESLLSAQPGRLTWYDKYRKEAGSPFIAGASWPGDEGGGVSAGSLFESILSAFNA